MRDQNSISVILPVYNEEGNIRQTVEDVFDFLKRQKLFSDYEVITVDDGSTDRTAHVLTTLTERLDRLRIVTHDKNFGYGKTLTSGIKKSRFALVHIMDADGQFKINALEHMIRYLPDYDIIAGYRHKRADSFYRIILGETYTFLADVLFGLKLKDVNCGFKLFKREALNVEGVNGHAGVFYTTVLLQAKAMGYKIKEVSVEHFPRGSGKQTGASGHVIFEAIADVVKMKFSRKNKPIKEKTV